MAYTRIAPDIYQDSRTGNFYERPTINGCRTWRRLDGHTLTLAKKSFAQRQTDSTRAKLGLARDPYRPAPPTTGEILDDYIAANCPCKTGHPRTGRQLALEKGRLGTLRSFWSVLNPEALHTENECRAYAARRRREVRKGCDKARAIDLELQTLAAAFHHALRLGVIDKNPLATRPQFQAASAVRHCRDAMPANAKELHALASYLFETPIRHALGWQLLLEALTGCRTSEVLALRRDAAPRQPGHIDGDHLWLARAKGGANPFCFIHPALRACLIAMEVWHTTRRVPSPWYLPSPRIADQPLDNCALSHRLRVISPLICANRPVTSHGLRAYFVTVRRSQGVSDAQIAAEIGDRSGAQIIVDTYGAIPPNWKGAAGLAWVPEKTSPAWSRFLPYIDTPIESDSDSETEAHTTPHTIGHTIFPLMERHSAVTPLPLNARKTA